MIFSHLLDIIFFIVVVEMVVPVNHITKFQSNNHWWICAAVPVLPDIAWTLFGVLVTLIGTFV